MPPRALRLLIVVLLAGGCAPIGPPLPPSVPTAPPVVGPMTDAPAPSAERAAPLPAAPPPGFYAPVADDVQGPPGSLIASLEIAAPEGLRAWAVLYRSRGIHDAPVAVSGMVLAPADAPAAGAPPRPVLAWAHGTTGLADACAPSRSGVNGGGLTLLADVARQGFVVTATDYEGLGTDGIHPYLVGTSEGRSILDAVRAVHALPAAWAGMAAGIIGISQGAHAALWAAELAPAYAPEVSVVGTVAASPPIDLLALERAVLGQGVPTPVSTMEALLVAAAWSDVYGIDLAGFVSPEGVAVARALHHECPWEAVPPETIPFTVAPTTVPAWRDLLVANSPGHGRIPGPVLAIAARNDEQVPASTIPLGIDRLCAVGDRIELRWTDGDHVSTLADPESAAGAFAWLRDRFLGLPAAGTAAC